MRSGSRTATGGAARRTSSHERALDLRGRDEHRRRDRARRPSRRRGTRPSPTPHRTRRRPPPPRAAPRPRAAPSRGSARSSARSRARACTQRRRHVVRKVRDHRPRVRRRAPRAQSTRQRVGVHDLDVAPGRRPPRAPGRRCRSSSIARTCAPASSSATVSEPTPGPDLDDAVAGLDAGEAHDAPRGVRVGEEVLAERLARAQVVRGEQLADRRASSVTARRRTRAPRSRASASAISVGVDAARPRQRRADRDDERGLVRLAAVRLGREVRRVGLDEQPVGGRRARPRRATSSAFLNETMPLNDR